ncbi:hypothetical protein B9G55_09565 [Saccharibacillus sp. O16]|nr:hypothetical protein B9G55_09565 [Saccharibacillus sp. O16]
MQTSNPLRTAIKQNMRKRGYNFSALSDRSGIPRGSLSLIFVGGASRRSPMSFQHLIRISEALGLPEDAFFDLYVDECFVGGRPNRSRIEPFLERCIELGHPNCVDRVLDKLNGEPRYLPLLFQIAENTHQDGTKSITERLYEYLLLHNGSRHSVEVAICHYRLFLLRLGEDEEVNSKALNAFSPYRDNLPDEFKLEALLAMCSLNLSRMDADELEASAEELIALCLRLFGTRDRPPAVPFVPEHSLPRPALCYYSQGYIMKQIALCERGDYREAMLYSEMYGDLSWLSDDDPKDQQKLQTLQEVAYATHLGCELLDGNSEVLPEYVGLLEAYPRETASGLIVMLKTANRHALDIDEWLRRFPLDLEYTMSLQDNAYNKQVTRNRFARLLYQLSIYHYSRGRVEESLQTALQSWELSHQLNNHRMFRLLASLTLMYSGQCEPTDL